MRLTLPARTTRSSAPSDRTPRPVRVSFLIDNLGRAGTETQLLALIRTLDRSRVEPTLVLLDGESEESRQLEPTDCPVLRLGVKKLFGRSAARAAGRLRRHWRDSRTEIAQIYFLDSAYFGVPVAKLAGVPKIIRVRNNLGYWTTRKHRLLSRVIRPFVDVTLTNSEAGRDALVSRDGLSVDRVTVIENGVDVEGFPFPGHRPFSGPSIRVGCVANLRSVKNIDGLMRVAASLLPDFPNLTFEVAGEGEERPALERLHRELMLGERFRLLGAVRDIPAFLGGLDVAVLPSHTEGMSNALLESMAAGRPIVATDVGASAKLLDDGACGVLVPSGRAETLSDGLRKLLTNPALARTLGVAARERVARHYSRDAMRLRFEEFYLRLAGVPVD